MAETRLTRRAQKELEALPGPVREAVIETVEAIGVDPQAAGKQLVGRLRGLWSARVGNYRVLYTTEDQAVTIRSIRHRAVAYGRRRS